MAENHSLQSFDMRMSDFAKSPKSPMRRTAASYERELELRRRTELALREALAREDALLRQKDELIQQRELLSRESDHRLLNGMQVIVSLLSLQSRTSTNAEAAAQLAVAANRVAMIERVHRRLHYLDNLQSVALKQYLGDLCRDLSAMLIPDRDPEQAIVFNGLEVKLPTIVAIPLGFIVSELITNAVKYGKGQITVELEQSSPGAGYSLSVANEGAALPEGFDPAASNGLGMKIIGAFVKQIGGELRIDRGEDNQGARFTVRFSSAEK